MSLNYKNYEIAYTPQTPYESDDIDWIIGRANDYYYEKGKLLLKIPNTKGITSSQLRNLNPNIDIRIAGGYDAERIKHKGHLRFTNGETGEYLTNAVIYTRNETIKIIEEIEKIESGIDKNWSDIQKVVYVYDQLNSRIMADRKAVSKPSSEIRSLRGLITKQTVCAGCAIIFKEIMDRQGIECEYVEGAQKYNGDYGEHAWNIVTIDGKKYPIDLTSDNLKLRIGDYNTLEFLGQNVETFSKCHYPEPWAPTQNYEYTLSQINPDLIKLISKQIERTREYDNTTYCPTRKDGSHFILAQVGKETINNKNYYRYYYLDDAVEQPLILYSDTNVVQVFGCKKLGASVPEKLEETLINILFSRENIADSLARKTNYIGRCGKNNKSNKLELVTSVSEIDKPEEKKNLFTYPTKCFTRSNGTWFIAHQMLKEPLEVNGIKVMSYDIFEMVDENGRDVLKKNTVFTEKNLFKDPKQSMVDIYLSRSRLDRKVKEAGGYIGYYDADGIKRYNPNLVSYFETSKKINIDSLDKSIQNKESNYIFNEDLTYNNTGRKPRR